ncbi:nucleosome assembly protein [Lophiotrema nucula]|uniref:Nucleosome assembly protein n=1 Tax=Lophiotrema nucula TaxID=690887 RepID=A0A6A5YFG5_9PLEO|nr:nucleosome assembly protein [Lophiotrema nucula]
MADIGPEEILARFEELSVLESEIEQAELEIIRTQYTLHAPIYKKRAAVIAKIPHFWALVFEQSPPEVDTYIQPSDSKVFAECLESLDVTRFEIDDPKGSPKSFALRFTFAPNDYFEDSVLEKKFYYRRSLDGFDGFVSEPVKIHWKKGKDLSDGLTDAAYKLWQAQQKLGNGDNRAAEKRLPEYKSLAKKMESDVGVSTSFFTIFGFVSSFRYVSAEESQKARKIEKENSEKRRRGEKVEDEGPNDDDEDYQETEVFPGGDEPAMLIAEDMWPAAIRYFSKSPSTALYTRERQANPIGGAFQRFPLMTCFHPS